MADLNSTDFTTEERNNIKQDLKEHIKKIVKDGFTKETESLKRLDGNDKVIFKTKRVKKIYLNVTEINRLYDMLYKLEDEEVNKNRELDYD